MLQPRSYRFTTTSSQLYLCSLTTLARAGAVRERLVSPPYLCSSIPFPAVYLPTPKASQVNLPFPFPYLSLLTFSFDFL